MIIGKIEDGIVLDHITAGKGIKLYELMHLDELECEVALIQNASSEKMGKKDILKIDKLIDFNVDVVGYMDPGVTLNIIKGGKLAKRSKIEMPEKVVNVIKCKNPRCITTVEQELPQVFNLTDREKGIYRCAYCESKAK